MRAPASPRVDRPVMYQRWSQLSFLHWRYPAATIQRLLPRPLEVQTHDGYAWIGLVPFLMSEVRAPGLPVLPWLSAFPETNVRTYVRAPDGTTGIWFFSLDAARLPAVLGGRVGYGLPYSWSDMSVRTSDGRTSYASRRRWPGPSGAGCRVVVESGTAVAPDALDELELFLTERHRLYARFAGRLITALAEHPPWPLHRAAVPEWDETLLAAAGVPAPEAVPLAHTSPGVTVRISRWARVER